MKTVARDPGAFTRLPTEETAIRLTIFARATSRKGFADFRKPILELGLQPQRQLALEGRLIAPWVAELRTAWTKAQTQLDGRELVIDMGNDVDFFRRVTCASPTSMWFDIKVVWKPSTTFWLPTSE